VEEILMKKNIKKDFEDLKYRFELRSLETGKTHFQYVTLNNDSYGLIQFPIQTDRWAIINIDRFTGKYDNSKEKKGIYQNDIIRYKVNASPYGYQEFIALVQWDITSLSFTCKVRENYTHNHLCHCEKIEHLGNIRENPELIHDIGEVERPFKRRTISK
jgi:hypothetical protein